MRAFQYHAGPDDAVNTIINLSCSLGKKWKWMFLFSQIFQDPWKVSSVRIPFDCLYYCYKCKITKDSGGTVQAECGEKGS